MKLVLLWIALVLLLGFAFILYCCVRVGTRGSYAMGSEGKENAHNE